MPYLPPDINGGKSPANAVLAGLCTGSRPTKQAPTMCYREGTEGGSRCIEAVGGGEGGVVSPLRPPPPIGNAAGRRQGVRGRAVDNGDCGG